MILRHSINNVNYDYDESDYEEAPERVSYLNDEDEDEEITHEDQMSIDDDTIMDSLNDAHISKRKTRAKTIKKKKKNEQEFAMGDNVVYRKKPATVIYGPYEK